MWLHNFQRPFSSLWSHQSPIYQAVFIDGLRISFFPTKALYMLLPSHLLSITFSCENCSLDFPLQDLILVLMSPGKKTIECCIITTSKPSLERWFGRHFSRTWPSMWSEVVVWYRRTETRPASLQGQLNDGRTWRKHVDDVLQNRPSPVATESGTIIAQV